MDFFFFKHNFTLLERASCAREENHRKREMKRKNEKKFPHKKSYSTVCIFFSP